MRRGIVPDAGGAYLLPRLVGRSEGQGVAVLRRRRERSRRRGHGPGQQGRTAADLEAARTSGPRVWPTSPTRAIALTKALVNRSLDSDRSTAFAEEAMAQDVAMTTADANEGVAAFVERRDPTYRGW